MCVGGGGYGSLHKGVVCQAEKHYDVALGSNISAIPIIKCIQAMRSLGF